MNLEFDEFKISNYNLNFNTIDNVVYIIYGKDDLLIKDLLLYIAGINKIDRKNGNIKYNKNIVFDNKDYFKSRIFFDMHYNYLNTITPSLIQENLNIRFNINYDEKLFKRKLIEQNARKEIKVNTKCEFTKLGLSLVNYALVSSLNVDNLIIYDLFHNIDDDKKREYIVHDIMNRNNKGMIISVSSLKEFLNQDVMFIMLGDFGKAYLVNKSSKFIITENTDELEHRIFELDNNMVICLKEDEVNVKKGLFKGAKKKEISLSDFSKYGCGYGKK